MAQNQRVTDEAAPARVVRHGSLGPTGPAPLVPSGAAAHAIKQGVLVQWATGIAYVGGTGIGTGMGHQLGPSGALADGSFHQVFVRADSLRNVWINAPAGMVRWIAT